MRLIVLMLLALAACTTASRPPAIPPTPSTPPPMPPRMERFAHITGSVTDLAGSPVPSAVLRVWSADASCQRTDRSKEIESDHRGLFITEVEFGTGADIQGCVVVEALAGGGSATAQTPVLFSIAEGADAPNRAHVDVRIGPTARLDRAEADRIVGLLNNGMRSHDPAVNRELLPYVRVGMAELWGLLTDHAYLLRGIASTELIGTGANSFTYLLRGTNGKTLTTTVTQNVLTDLTNPIIQHGARARTLLRTVIGLSRNGETARLAAVLGTDRSRAEELAERLRTGYDDQSVIRIDFVDETAQTLRYRIVATREASSPEQIVELGYSDQGALWLRSF